MPSGVSVYRDRGADPQLIAVYRLLILPKEVTGPRTRRLGDVFGRWRRLFFLSKHFVLCFFGTHASLVKPKNRLHRLKSSPWHTEYQYTVAQKTSFGRVSAHFCDACPLLIAVH